MQVSAAKLQALTVAAILVLISGGIAVYAQGQSISGGSTAFGAPVALATGGTNSTTSSTSSTSSATTSSTTGSTVTSTVTTTVTATTSTTTANNTLCQPTSPKVGRVVLPITAVGASAGSSTSAISFSNSRGCSASITTVGGVFDVQIVLRYAKPVTQYNVILVANGTSYTLGNMVTDQSGSGQMDNQVLLTTGTYTVSIQIYDTSSNPGHSVLVLQTGQGTVTSPPFPTASSGQPQVQFGQGGQAGPHR